MNPVTLDDRRKRQARLAKGGIHDTARLDQLHERGLQQSEKTRMLQSSPDCLACSKRKKRSRNYSQPTTQLRMMQRLAGHREMLLRQNVYSMGTKIRVLSGRLSTSLNASHSAIYAKTIPGPIPRSTPSTLSCLAEVTSLSVRNFQPMPIGNQKDMLEEHTGSK